MEESLTTKLLKFINEEGKILSTEVAQRVQQPHQKVVGAIKSLESLGNVVEVQQQVIKSWACTEEGEQLANEGSHEAKLFFFIPAEGGDSIGNIKKNFPTSAVALGVALKNKWVRKDGEMVFRCVENIVDNVKINLQSIREGSSSKVDDKSKLEYKKRKLIKEMDITIFEVKKGSDFSTSVSKQEAELTKDMIESGQWKNKTFKPFNFNAKGKSEVRPGYLHPLMQLRGEFRHIFLEMGFTEMPTNNYIESAFWNFDALFQPQQHPARDAQDTFYISDPANTLSVPMDYLEKVKQIHSTGGYGSIGYRSPWSFEESQKNLLRTHTTAVSARLLCKLAQEGFKPVKYFSIDKVYRNETLDATHLAEFHQVEGVIADYNLSMKHLMGIFTAFFEKIGIRNIRFKPTYNPYTEPSMEIYSFHSGLKKWVEVGNSGYFRPEMLRPMGLPSNVTVAGWGLSLERPAMIMFGINNIRELVGSKVKMELILENPVCTIDKFSRSLRPKTDSSKTIDDLVHLQDGLLKKLENLKGKALSLAESRGINIEEKRESKGTVPTFPDDIVLTADPHRPPYSLYPLVSAILEFIPMTIAVHTHSSVDVGKISNEHVKFLSHVGNNKHIDGEVRKKITLVWKSNIESGSQPTLSVNPLIATKVTGESNIARYFSRLIDSQKLSKASSLYESGDLALVASIDEVLEKCHLNLSEGTSKKENLAFLRSLNTTLQKSNFLCGQLLTVADLVALSTLRQLNLTTSNYPALQKWMDLCSKDSLASLVLYTDNERDKC